VSLVSLAQQVTKQTIDFLSFGLLAVYNEFVIFIKRSLVPCCFASCFEG